MRLPILAAILLVAAVAGAAAGLVPRPVAVFHAEPTRPYAVLGPVAAASEARPAGTSWTALHAEPLVADARARYARRPDALIRLAHEPLPNGAGARTTALAVRWAD